MLARMRTAAKFFTIGLALGLLLAPDAGRETRRQLVESLKSSLRQLRDRARQSI